MVYRAIMAHRDTLNRMHETASAKPALITQTDDPISMVENLVRLAAQGAGANSASLYMVRDGALHPWYVYGLSPEYVAACGPVRIGEQCCGRAVAFKKPWVVGNMLTDPDWARTAIAQLQGRP